MCSCACYTTCVSGSSHWRGSFPRPANLAIERVEWLSFENKGSSNCLMLTDRVLDLVLVESNHFLKLLNRSRS